MTKTYKMLTDDTLLIAANFPYTVFFGRKMDPVSSSQISEKSPLKSPVSS